MKNVMKITVIFALLLVTNIAHAEFYKVNVRRVDGNLYSFKSGSVEGVIQTKYCYEYTYSDDAILKYEKGSYENKLIFSSGTTCDVAGVFTK